MTLHFYKFHGTGNDFILIDNRDSKIKNLYPEQIKYLCHRNFGIGADGLMLLNKHAGFDFEMDYYNSDGSGGAMCGNGGRCIVAFAKKLGIIQENTKFIASDGAHEASINELGEIKLKMIDVQEITNKQNNLFIDTGAPHHIEFNDNIEELNVYEKGRKIRYSNEYIDKGTNVNFVQVKDKGIEIRTYERGVENETLACGTGAVASAISYYIKHKPASPNINVKTLGGDLQVSFMVNENKYTEVYLAGPAKFVFEGQIELIDN
ncbi:MAG: diaminopimelate epimerase [Bacteroidota bacterium]